MKPEELGAYYESILDEQVRKAGGIYYTQQYIVDCIVGRSLGALLKNYIHFRHLANQSEIRSR